jgi:hypothetical protein
MNLFEGRLEPQAPAPGASHSVTRDCVDKLGARVDGLLAKMEAIDIKAEAGLCYFTLESAREFLKDIRAIVAVAQRQPCIGDDPLCPCQDGDACHYRDVVVNGVVVSRGFPVPVVAGLQAARARLARARERYREAGEEVDRACDEVHRLKREADQGHV